MREDTDRGFRDFSGNEQTIGSTIDDPAAMRVASPSGTNKISYNLLGPDGKTQYEKVLLIGGNDPIVGWFLDFMTQEPNRVDDAGMVRRARLSRAGFELFVPLIHSTPPPVPPGPPDPSDPTHGIPEGDFARILEIYGFESDWQEPWQQGRVTSWPAVIERQDIRDDYRHFPRTPPPPPIMMPEERAEREKDVTAVGDEFFPMELDADKVQAYLSGRSSLREFHNDNVERAGAHRPEFHRPGRPY